MNLAAVVTADLRDRVAEFIENGGIESAQAGLTQIRRIDRLNNYPDAELERLANLVTEHDIYAALDKFLIFRLSVREAPRWAIPGTATMGLLRDAIVEGSNLDRLKAVLIGLFIYEPVYAILGIECDTTLGAYLGDFNLTDK